MWHVRKRSRRKYARKCVRKYVHEYSCKYAHKYAHKYERSPEYARKLGWTYITLNDSRTRPEGISHLTQRDAKPSSKNWTQLSCCYSKTGSKITASWDEFITSLVQIPSQTLFFTDYHFFPFTFRLEWAETLFVLLECFRYFTSMIFFKTVWWLYWKLIPVRYCLNSNRGEANCRTHLMIYR